MKNYNLDGLYSFINDLEEDWSYIKINSGPLKDSTVKVNNIGFDEPDGEDAIMHIDYDWIEQPKEDISQQEISNILGNIISDIIINHIFKD